jgi:D-amino-acid dehydrogenase
MERGDFYEKKDGVRSMSDVMVLGAGMVGVSTALALQAAGKSVVIVDRKGPGQETSYGNAGVIQAEAVEPYALPLDPVALVKIAFKLRNDINYHFSALPSHVRPVWEYFLASLPGRYKEISKTYSKLALRSTADHAPLIAASGADNLIRRGGLRFVFRTQEALDKAAKDAERIHEAYGPPMKIIDGAELAVAEPSIKIPLKGAVHWTGSWSCMDPGGLTEAYANLFVSRGGTIVTGDAETLTRAENGWTVKGPDGPVTAANVVVALGPWSPLLLKKFGYDIPLLRKRGYHRHFAGGATLNAPVFDSENATVISPMIKGIRVLTGAELARFGAMPTPVQLEHSSEAAGELLDLGKPVEAEPWFGNRPCMPDMLPLVGKAPRHDGLWFHFGHGHQGFTLGPTTSALLAEEMTGGTAPVPELSPSRLKF